MAAEHRECPGVALVPPDAPLLRRTAGEVGNKIFVDLFFDRACPAELSGKAHIGIVEAGAVGHLDKVFRIALAETVDQSEAVDTVAAGHVLCGITVAVKVEVFVGIDDRIRLGTFKVNAVIKS